MRWIVAVLLLLNFSTYLWGTLKPRQTAGIEFAPREVGSIRLLSELSEVEDVLPVKDATLEIGIADISDAQINLPTIDLQAVAKPPEVSVCGELVWLETLESAMALVRTLNATGARASATEQIKQESDGYWVMIPPQPDRVVAQQWLSGLEAQGVQDTWLMPSGPFQNAISLGLYTRESRAGTRADEIRQLGFDAQVRPNINEISGYSVNYRTFKRNTESVLRAVTAQSELIHREIQCK